MDIQKHLLLQSRHPGQCLTDDTKQFLMAQSLELIIRKTVCRLLQFVFYLLEARPAAKIIHTLIINHREKQPDYISLAVQLFPLFQETQQNVAHDVTCVFVIKDIHRSISQGRPVVALIKICKVESFFHVLTVFH